MLLDLTTLPTEVADLLRLDGDGARHMPLVAGRCSSAEAARRLQATSAADWFAGSRSPQGALAGLWVYFSAFAEAHGVAQDLSTPEGSYWHGILHRQEPDPGNAGYWFRRVGKHPIFPALQEAAEVLGYLSQGHWDPFAFVDFCEAARRRPGSPDEVLALKVQSAEWQILFNWCAQPMRP